MKNDRSSDPSHLLSRLLTAHLLARVVCCLLLPQSADVFVGLWMHLIVVGERWLLVKAFLNYYLGTLLYVLDSAWTLKRLGRTSAAAFNL